MPAIYYKHELIEERALRRNSEPGVFAIPKHLVEHALDVSYVIVVDNGKAWAARRILRTAASSFDRVLIRCVHYSDEITGKQILLKHLLQGD